MKSLYFIWLIALALTFGLGGAASFVASASADVPAGEKKAYRQCLTDAKDTASLITNYEKFATNYPKSALADDALFEVAQLYEGIGKTEEAIATWQRIEKDYGETNIKRHIFLGDPDKEWLDGWREFVEANPIKARDWARAQIAGIHLKTGKLKEAREILEKLLETTSKPKWEGDYNPAIQGTEDIRRYVLRVSYELSRETKDEALKQRLEKTYEAEYGRDLSTKSPIF